MLENTTLAQLLAWIVGLPVFIERIPSWQNVPPWGKIAVLGFLNLVAFFVTGYQSSIDPVVLQSTIAALLIQVGIMAMQFLIHKVDEILTAYVVGLKQRYAIK